MRGYLFCDIIKLENIRGRNKLNMIKTLFLKNLNKNKKQPL